MPPPIPVELQPYTPAWTEAAQREAARIADALGANLIAVYHVGSTAIPEIRAKPILDLLPVVTDLLALDGARARIEALGCAWWGEHGLPGRRYCTQDDPVTGRRCVQLHCFAQGSPEIERHVAFRDYLRSHPDLARAYDAEKERCRASHPLDSHAYTGCKSEWIRRIELEAVRCYRASQHPDDMKQREILGDGGDESEHES